ncbi:MAG: UDP-3-O-(3-hydroxymyristoyl)glucosamine N-acyltransferase [Acidobacteriota bacterium]|nr:UDP-3-O-(3-hydroxymyristoyl)glucosamine N-acyltransferase [Blastocatellia bacterium]MDW8413496.1 UDP-3-O-(3-hydroxymyristoyl)glucosamine N-acyltransferase [Acidobacteriota bacterium]
MPSIYELAKIVGATVKGEDRIVTGVASPQRAGEGDLIFIDSARHLTAALASRSQAVVAPPSLEDYPDGKSYILTEQPKLVFARLVPFIISFTPPKPGIHPTAVIGQNVLLGRDVHIGAYVVIGDEAKIGDRSVVMPSCVLGNRVTIGDDCKFFPGVVIYDGVSIGSRVVIHAGSVIGSDGFGYVFDGDVYHKFPQIGNVIIEEDVEIGSNCCIDRAALDSTVIERGTKIDNLVQIAHNVLVGRSVVIAAQTGISGSSVVEEHVVLGGQVGIADHVRICKKAVVGAQAGVPTGKVIRSGQTVWGTPARPIDEFKQVYAHVQQLPALKKRIEELEYRLSLLEKAMS